MLLSVITILNKALPLPSPLFFKFAFLYQSVY